MNWANLPNDQEFEFGNINLVVGESGSGKTTLLDAVQTVLTAAYRGLFQFNPGQDEATQQGHKKIPRTLGSYILGCDDGAYARQFCDGYVALVFVPNKNEPCQVFSAILAARAHVEKVGETRSAREDTIKFFIVKHPIIREDFLIKGKSDKLIKLEDLAGNLAATYGREHVESFSEKREYLARLYGLFTNKLRSLKWRDAARSFSRFMAYKQIRDLNDFVMSEILEARDIGDTINKTSSMMRSLNEMEREAKHIQASTDLLSEANQLANGYKSEWGKYNLIGYSQARLLSNQLQAQWLMHNDQRESLELEKKNLEQETLELARRSKALSEQHIQLEAKKQGSEQAIKIDELRNRKHDRETYLASQGVKMIEELSNSILFSSYINEIILLMDLLAEKPGNKLRLESTLSNILNSVSALDIEWLHTLRQSVKENFFDSQLLEQYKDSSIEFDQLSKKILDAFDNTNGSAESFSDKVNQVTYHIEGEIKSLEERVENITNQINSLENNNRIRYPQSVEYAVKVINQYFPAAEVSVLCDHIEVLDKTWQQAIEGYLGGTRYNIIVAPKFEASASELVRSLKSVNAKIIQGSLAKKDSESISNIKSNSIIKLLKFSHPTAKHFMYASFANVEQVESSEKLRSVRRGITADGLGSAGYTMFPCSESIENLVLGKEARLRALQQKKEQKIELLKKLTDLRDVRSDYKNLRTILQTIKPISLSEVLRSVVSSLSEITEIEKLLAKLDQTEYQALLNSIKKIKEDLADLSQTEKDTERQIGAVDNQLKQLSASLKQLAITKDNALIKVDQCEKNLQSIQTIWIEFSATDEIEKVESNLDSVSDDLLKDLQEQRAKSEQRLDKRREQLRTKLTVYMENPVSMQKFSHSLDDVEYRTDEMFTEIVKIGNQLSSLLDQLNHHILANKKDKIDRIRKEFDHTFVTDLCQNVFSAVKEGRERLKERNKELENLSFGTDQESYEFMWDWVPEYKSYYDFFKEVIDSDSIFQTEMTEKSKKVRQQIEDMLLSTDQDRAYQNLQRICDYRNYRKYDILKKVPGKDPIRLSRYGTGSGGQLETPSYVIRAAGLSGAMEFHNEVSFRCVLIDESFSKMDEARSKRVIEYLTKNLQLQLIFVMPTRGAGPFEELVTHRFNIAKVSSTQLIGDLKTQVLVDARVMKRDNVAELISTHKQQLYRQAEIGFLQLLEDESSEPADSSVG